MDSDVVKAANWDQDNPPRQRHQDQDRERPESRKRPRQDQDDEKPNGYSWR